MPPTLVPSVEPLPAPEQPRVAEVWRILVDALRVVAVAVGVYLLASWFHPLPHLAQILRMPNPLALADVTLVLLACVVYYLVVASRRSTQLAEALRRVQEAEALQAVERAQLYTVLDSAPALVFVLNPDRSFGFVNHAFREAMGDPAGRRCYQVLHGCGDPCAHCHEWDSAGEPRERLAEMGGRNYVVRQQILAADGSHTEKQRLYVAVDITERQRAEERLRRAEEHLRLAQQVARMGSWTMDLRTNQIRCSPEMGAMLGMELGDESIPVKRLMAVLHPEDHAFVDARVRDAQQGILHDMQGRQRVVLPDGTQKTLLSRRRVIRDEAGQIVEILGATVDITDDVRIEEDLRRSRDLLAVSQRIGQMGGWEYTVANGEMMVTDTLRDIHDDHASDVTLTRGFGFYVEEHRPKVERAFWRAAYHGEPYDLEARVTTAAGRECWMRTIGRPVLEDGRVVRVQGIRMDITERKEADQQREALISELQEALARVRRLSGLLPICPMCKRVRSDEGYWEDVAAYISEHSDVEFTHSLCPTCLIKLYPEDGPQVLLDDSPKESEA